MYNSQEFVATTKRKFLSYMEEVQSNRVGLTVLAEIESLQDLINELGLSATYLSTAEATLPTEDNWISSMKAVRNEILSQIADTKRRAAASFRQHAQSKLTELKKEFVNAYLELHKKARLGVNEDKRKAKLMTDDRLKILQKLSTIELMPRHQLTDFQNQLAGLKSCFSLTEQELHAAPACPHCEFRPSTEPLVTSSSMLIGKLEESLDDLVKEWTKTLLNNLADPTIQENLNLLKQKPLKLIQSFVGSKELPDEISNEFLEALKEVLTGLVKVEIKSDKLKLALLEGGSPVTVDELIKRFDDFINSITKGKEQKKIRIVID